MAKRCRYCGTFAGDLAPADHACPQCVRSADCARCGHPRSAHVGTFADGRRCAHVWVAEWGTLATGCACAGFAAAFASLDEQLRLVVAAQRGESVPAAPGR